MITRRGLFKGLFAVAGAVVLKPFVFKDERVFSEELLEKAFSSIETSNGNVFNPIYFFYEQYIKLPYIDLSDGKTGFVKYTSDESESWKDNHLRLTSDFREKGLDINLSDGGLIRVTALGSWYRYGQIFYSTDLKLRKIKGDQEIWSTIPLEGENND